MGRHFHIKLIFFYFKENTSLASKLSELLLKEESRLEKSQQRKRKLNFSKEEGNENKIITNREILEQCIRNKNLGEDEDLTKPSSSTTNNRFFQLILVLGCRECYSKHSFLTLNSKPDLEDNLNPLEEIRHFFLSP